MKKISPDNIYGEQFLLELYHRTKSMAFTTDGGNSLIIIDLKGAARSFSTKLEEILSENSDKFSVRIKGEEYIVELLNKRTFSVLYASMCSQT